MQATDKTYKTYNGWTNYETWGCSLVLDNDEGSYNYAREMAETFKREAGEHPNVESGLWTKDEAATFTLEDWLKGYTETLCGLEGDSLPMMARQLLSGAIDSVDFREIAESLLTD